MRDGIIIWYEGWYNITRDGIWNQWYMESVVYGIRGIKWNQGYNMESEMVESEMNTCVINGWE